METGPIAHAIRYARVTATAARRALALSPYCALCGSETKHVAFFENGYYSECCIACAAQANLTTR